MGPIILSTAFSRLISFFGLAALAAFRLASERLRRSFSRLAGETSTAPIV
jgi:hypothetical protein